jgi:hypothetical protein
VEREEGTPDKGFPFSFYVDFIAGFAEIQTVGSDTRNSGFSLSSPGNERLKPEFLHFVFEL